ncbi:MAG: DUF2303 family protein [Rhodobacteraceae bacterium]|nr:DUF2303 family protein [Paracoccaceae bacterium]
MNNEPENYGGKIVKKIEALGIATEIFAQVESIIPERDSDVEALEATHLVSVPAGRKVQNITKEVREASEYLKPHRRAGVAKMDDLQSLIRWADRFKGESSVLYAKPDISDPSLTCIADYHLSGPSVINHQTGEPTARHCEHRAVYKFPLSDEWKAWMEASGNPMEKDELGEFIEVNAKDIMDPTPAILSGKVNDKNADWENRLITTAAQIEGRYGQLTQLLAMSKMFQVFETSDLTVQTNRDTGESQIQFLNEHKGADGQPLNIPNLIIIAIPVYQGGALYRMPVRFRYRKRGSSVKFILSAYNPEKAFKAALNEAVDLAAEATGLETFMGTPET